VQKATDRKRLVLEKVAPKIATGHRACPECAKALKLTLGPFGPYLKCGSDGCKGKRSVSYEIVDAAVKDSAMPCECGGLLRLKRGATTFLGCTMYPACRKPIAWKDL
jgi:ssDNA-binding Zn-finger/Zn-ribbon topoisomerase 1